MKKLMKNRLIFGIVVSVMAMAVLAGIVYAATIVQLSSQVNIVAATNDIKVFSDPACKYEITSLTWADLPQGGESTKRIYILNTGNTDAEVTATLVGAPTGLFLKEGSDVITVTAGKSAGFDLMLEANTTATVGSPTFTVNLTCAPAFVNPPVTTTTTTTTTP